MDLVYVETVVTSTVTEIAIVGRTVLQVSRSIRRSVDFTAELLAELERDGIAEQVDGVWRLTEWAEARFGRTFRELSI